jgi:hypothetical protein
VECSRHDARQRLAFACLHLDNRAIGQGKRRHDLLVERPLPEHA